MGWPGSKEGAETEEEAWALPLGVRRRDLDPRGAKTAGDKRRALEGSGLNKVLNDITYQGHASKDTSTTQPTSEEPLPESKSKKSSKERSRHHRDERQEHRRESKKKSASGKSSKEESKRHSKDRSRKHEKSDDSRKDEDKGDSLKQGTTHASREKARRDEYKRTAKAYSADSKSTVTHLTSDDDEFRRYLEAYPSKAPHKYHHDKDAKELTPLEKGEHALKRHPHKHEDKEKVTPKPRDDTSETCYTSSDTEFQQAKKKHPNRLFVTAEGNSGQDGKKSAIDEVTSAGRRLLNKIQDVSNDKAVNANSDPKQLNSNNPEKHEEGEEGEHPPDDEHAAAAEEAAAADEAAAAEEGGHEGATEEGEHEEEPQGETGPDGKKKPPPPHVASSVWDSIKSKVHEVSGQGANCPEDHYKMVHKSCNKLDNEQTNQGISNQGSRSRLPLIFTSSENENSDEKEAGESEDKEEPEGDATENETSCAYDRGEDPNAKFGSSCPDSTSNKKSFFSSWGLTGGAEEASTTPSDTSFAFSNRNSSRQPKTSFVETVSNKMENMNQNSKQKRRQKVSFINTYFCNC